MVLHDGGAVPAIIMQRTTFSAVQDIWGPFDKGHLSPTEPAAWPMMNLRGRTSLAVQILLFT
jgi:hypothetical protein